MVFQILLQIKRNYIENDKKQEITEELNRITYKEGFYYEEIGSKIKERITGISFPNEFDNQYTSISYDDLRYINIKHYDFNGAMIKFYCF